MKRYLVFAGADYYPSGGWGDFIDSFDDIETARDASPNSDWLEVVNKDTGEVIHRRNGRIS